MIVLYVVVAAGAWLSLLPSLANGGLSDIAVHLSAAVAWTLVAMYEPEAGNRAGSPRVAASRAPHRLVDATRKIARAYVRVGQRQAPQVGHLGAEPAPASDGLTLFRAMGLAPRISADPVGLGGLRHTREAAERDLRAARSDGWTDTWVEEATWRRLPAADSAEGAR